MSDEISALQADKNRLISALQDIQFATSHSLYASDGDGVTREDMLYTAVQSANMIADTAIAGTVWIDDAHRPIVATLRELCDLCADVPDLLRANSKPEAADALTWLIEQAQAALRRPDAD